MLKFKGSVQGCVFFLLLFTETESPSLQKSFRSAIVWILAEVWPYQQGHLAGIFLANFCKIFFRFEGSLLANCTRQSVEEDHYGNWYTKCIVSTILFLLPSRVNTSFHTLPVTELSRQEGGRRGEGWSELQFLTRSAQLRKLCRNL